MGKKDNPKVSVNALERIAKEQFEGVVTETWFDIDVIIKRSLPLIEMMEFCKEITDACFTGNGTFVPEVMDFAIKSGVLTHYANFTLPDNLEKQYWLIYNTGAYDMVLQHINMVQLNEIVSAANRKLRYLCDSDILMFRDKVTRFVDSMESMQKNTEDIFQGLSSEDVQTFVEAVKSSGSVSEESIVNAYIDRLKRDEQPSDGELEIVK